MGPKRPLEQGLNIEPTWDPSMCTKCNFLQYETPLRREIRHPLKPLRQKSAPPKPSRMPTPPPWTPLPGGAIAQIKTQLPALGASRHLRPLGAHLGLIWGFLGAHLGPTWGSFGAPLEHQMGPECAPNGRPEASWTVSQHGVHLGPPCVHQMLFFTIPNAPPGETFQDEEWEAPFS